MNAHKLKLRVLIGMLALILVLALAGKVVFMLLTGQITDENDVPLSRGFAGGLAAMIGIVCASYLYSVIVLLRQYVIYKGTAFSLTEDGVENTLTFVVILAFLFVVPVRRIPWCAVKLTDSEQGFHIWARRGQVQAGFLAGWILAIRGYAFCRDFVKPELSAEEYKTQILPHLPADVL